jgi:hypothetical protein
LEHAGKLGVFASISKGTLDMVIPVLRVAMFPSSTPHAEGRPLLPLAVGNGWLAQVGQLWRPFISAMIGSRYGDPSGLVSGVVVIAMELDLIAFFFKSEVIGAKLQDFAVILIFSWFFLGIVSFHSIDPGGHPALPFLEPAPLALRSNVN